MSSPAVWIALASVLALLLGLWLSRAGGAMRLRRGLGQGATVALDDVTLISQRLGLVGRPDRLVKSSGTIICEEWKSSATPRPWHIAQVGVYLLLIEEQFRVRPPHGFIVCGDGTRHRVDNTAELRALVLGLAAQIRAARREVSRSMPVDPRPGQCRPCGMRQHCVQARL